ncbi:MAG: S66 peptidase family protein [archaeon]
MIKPAPIEKGDMLAIIAPSSGSGSLFTHRVKNGIGALKALGFRIKIFPTLSKFKDDDAGTPEERAADVNDAFEDNDVKGIICSIGGLAANSILDLVDYKLIARHPKVFCGYSDITVLHHAFRKKSKLITFYGPALMTQFGESPKPLPYTVNHFLKAVNSKNPVGDIKPSDKWTDEATLDWSKSLDLTRPRILYKNTDGHIWLRSGKATAKITGGCLSSLLRLKGTKFSPDYINKILFIETSEGENYAKGKPLRYVDAEIMDLRNSGAFESIKGLIVGRPFGYSPNERKKFIQIIKKHIEHYSFPVLANANIGHADPIITIPLGVKVTLDSEKNLFSIDESGVK